MCGIPPCRHHTSEAHGLTVCLYDILDVWRIAASHRRHHWYPGAVRQGFYWWELDFTYYGLWLLSKFRIIRNLHAVPARVLERA